VNKPAFRDITVIGAGPAGMFAVFEAGMHDLSCHLVDALPQPGGQLAALYPDKPIYDLPGFPETSARDFVDRLEKQMQPANPNLVLETRIKVLERNGKLWRCHTGNGVMLESTAVFLAIGKGAFEPRRPGVAGIEPYENRSIFYAVTDPERMKGERVVIQGGGDSAFDWAIRLTELGAHVCLVHRRPQFRAHPRTVAKFRDMVAAGRAEMHVPGQVRAVEGNADEGALTSLTIATPDGDVEYAARYWLPLLGVVSDVGPLRDWGIAVDEGVVPVEAATMQTNLPAVYAIGDLCHYAGKCDLILVGFAEAAMAVRHAFGLCRPGEAFSGEYSTHRGAPHG